MEWGGKDSEQLSRAPAKSIHFITTRFKEADGPT